MFSAIKCFIGMHTLSEELYVYSTGPRKNRKITKRKKVQREFKKCLVCGAFIEVKKGYQMWVLIVWSTSFSTPMIKTTFDTEVQCRYTGAQFEVSYRETLTPIEFTCIKLNN